MKKHILRLGIIALVSAGSLHVMAVPAKPGVRTITASDGTELRVKLVGDEFFHQYFTEDGYPLTERNGKFYYCNYAENGDVINSGIEAKDITMRSNAAKQFLNSVELNQLSARIEKRASASPRRQSMVDRQLPVRNNVPLRAAGVDGPPFERGYGLFSDLRFPAYGEQKAIVILVEYQDIKFNTSYNAKEYFTRMLNEEDFCDSQFGGTGSAAQYFRTQSNGSFKPEFDVYGPITLSKNMAYYGANDWSGSDQHPADMVKEACDQLDATVDFKEYDRDGDGVVDNIFIFYAGSGEASGGSADTVWPHSWNMASAGYNNLKYDGVQVYTYGCSNEWEGSRPDGIGTFVHEFSHVMGLPDLYATNYSSAFTPGSWSALDYGPYNNDGRTPPNYGAFERYALGWIKPREVKDAVNATLQPIDQNVCGIIRSAKETEFFLLENRQKTGWDKYIPGHGMLIWHVDYNSTVWTNNTVNNINTHQYVDIEEADGSQSENSRGGDPFPGTSGKRSFTSETSPAMKTWSNVKLNYPLTEITETDGNITFKILGGSDVELEVPVAAVPESETVSSNGFTARWTKNGEEDVLLSVYTKDDDSTTKYAVSQNATSARHYVDGYHDYNVGSTDHFEVVGLEPETVYYYTVVTSNGWAISNESNEVSVYTGKATLDFYTPVATEATSVTVDGFTANWEELDGASEYKINVYTKKLGSPIYDVLNFDNGTESLPNGWTSTTAQAYGMTSYSGESSPSLRLSNGDKVQSPVYDNDINEVNFWHRGNGSNEGDKILVYGVIDGENELLSEISVVKEKGGATSTLTDIPEGTKQIMIEYKRDGVSGSLALDDIKIGIGYETEPQSLEAYTDYPVGNKTSFRVENLKYATDYYYRVYATDGTYNSKISNEVHVRTAVPAAVDNVGSETAFAVVVSGLELNVSTDDEIVVCDFSGMVVARGFSTVTLPRSGLWIVTVPAKNYARKLIIE